MGRAACALGRLAAADGEVRSVPEHLPLITVGITVYSKR